ncbi:MAG TPA: dihydropteroate synthase [Kofleriaceae bacterium]|nr:dihydropteroate synthase [Kofleriaceae bacterium]
MPISIRVGGPTDWRQWRELRLRALADAADAFGETLARASQRSEAEWRDQVAPQRGRVLFFADHDDLPVGMTVVRITPDAPTTARLYAMWVAPEARRLGAGRALIDAAMRWSRFAGARELALQVTDRNLVARQLYRETGFVDTGRVEALRPESELPTHVLVARLGPLVMGVVNVTPDSFSDGGDFYDPDAAVAHGLALLRDGADILDVGGEATNPRARPISAEEELRRILPVIEPLAQAGGTVSVDTTKAAVARAAVEAGASIINDISGGLFDREMASVVGELDVTYIVGHLRGTNLSETFAGEAGITWREVAVELGERIAALPAAARGRAWIDPGVGFGKGGDPETNLELLRHAGDLGRAVGCPVVVGPSRKRFLKRLVGGDPDLAALDGATVAACLGAVRAGAHVVRVHNVALLRAALAVYTRM